MTTLGDIHENVRLALKKGDTLDNVIPSRVKAAARWIERNRTLQYMRRIGSLSIDLASEFPWAIEMPSPNWKAIELVRVCGADGRIWDLPMKADYKTQTQFLRGAPTGYMLDGTSRLILNAIPCEEYYLEIFWQEYTSWPLATSSTNWLIENAFDLLEYQTMLYMALWLRDDRMAQVYTMGRNEALKTLVDEDELRVWTGTDEKMIYNPHKDEELEGWLRDSRYSEHST